MLLEDDTRTSELQQKIGRNLIRFQAIETFLKLVLPHIPPVAGVRDINDFREYRTKVYSSTLGALIGEFEQTVRVPQGFFEHGLKKVVDARNQLVHHLNQLPGVDWMGPTAAADAIAYLDKQFEEMAEFYEFTKLHSKATLLAILETYKNKNPEYEEYYQRVMTSLPSNFRISDKGDSERGAVLEPDIRT